MRVITARFEGISIHAPRTGSDPTPGLSDVAKGHFNPRSPHGERRNSWRGTRSERDFNPRSPHGERRRPPCPPTTATAHFNPRSPHGERRFHLIRRLLRIHISIHAPRTGSDIHEMRHTYISMIFQSTLPARGATWKTVPIKDRDLFQSTLPARGATLCGRTSICFF